MWIVIEGVDFMPHEIEMVLHVVNMEPPDFLDEGVGLNARAVRSIVERRPFGSIEELAAAPYVGEAALRRLRTLIR